VRWFGHRWSLRYSESFGSIEKLPPNKNICSTICCIGVIIDDMSKKQFEESLNYGDCNNIFCFIDKILDKTSGMIEKTIELIDKK
jgi:hypothetical protein